MSRITKAVFPVAGMGTRFLPATKDGIAALLKEEDVLALEYKGTRYDCGSKTGYLKAGLQFALRHPEVGSDFRRYLRGLDVRVPGKR